MSQNTMSRVVADLSGAFRAFHTSKKGRRNRNEDNLLVLIPSPGGKGLGTASLLREGTAITETVGNWPSDYARLAVADGMGGHAGGQEIAQAAVESLLTIAPAGSVEEMQLNILRLHSDLYRQFSGTGKRRPGTTLVMIDLCIRTGRGIGVSVGDSRAYAVFPGRGVRQLTHDHTVVEFDWRDGRGSRPVCEKAMRRNSRELVQALGNGSFGILKENDGFRPNRESAGIRLDLRHDLPPNLATHADVFEVRLWHGCAILLASDGLWHADPAGHWQGICGEEFLSDGEVQRQIETAMKDGSGDNISVVLFGFRKKNDGRKP